VKWRGFLFRDDGCNRIYSMRVPLDRVKSIQPFILLLIKEPRALKRATWQSIVAALNEQGGYEVLLNWLFEKYGIQ